MEQKMELDALLEELCISGDGATDCTEIIQKVISVQSK